MSKMRMVLIFWFSTYLIAAGQEVVDTAKVVKEVDSLRQIWNGYLDNGQLQEAFDLAKTTQQLVEAKLGKKSKQYASCQNAQGLACWELARYAEAEFFFLEAKRSVEEVFGKKHLIYASALNNLGLLYGDMNRPSDAESYFFESKLVIETISGTNNADYIQCLNNLGGLYYGQGAFEKAAHFYRLCEGISAATFGKESLAYARSQSNLGSVYMDLARYDSSEVFHLEAQKIRGKLLGTEHQSYANVLMNLANLQQATGRYAESESNYLEVLRIWEKTLGKKHPSYPMCLNNLAVLYKLTGKYDQAESTYIQATNLRREIVGEEHADFAISMGNLGILYMDMGRYSEAENCYLKEKNILTKTLGKQHPEYGKVLNNLSVLYKTTGRFQEAEQLLIESKTIQEEASLENTTFYALTLNNLGSFYAGLGRFQEAEPFFVKAKNIQQKTIGNRHFDYALTLLNLAGLYLDIGRYDEAEAFSLEAKDLQVSTLGRTHPEYAANLQNLIGLYQHRAHFTTCDALLNESLSIRQTSLAAGVRHLSEKELTEYTQTFQNEINRQISFHLYRPPNRLGSLPAISYDNILFYKGFLLQAASSVKNRALSDTATAKIWHRLAAFHRLLAAEYAKPIAERNATALANLEQQTNSLEKELARRVAGFGEAFKPINWQAVQHKLRSHETAIEFVAFKKSFPKASDTTFYAALLLRPHDTIPIFIPLFEEQKLVTALRRAAVSPKEQIEDVYRGKTLHNLLWQPLEPYLAGVKTVHFSPAGLLHGIAFAAIPTAPGQYLCDRYELREYGSTRELVTGQALLSASIQNARVYGGIRYDSSDNIYKSCDDDLLVFNRSGLGYLACSAHEMRQIQAVLAEKGVHADTLGGFEATEESMKPSRSAPDANHRSPDLLHISTHGAYLSSSEKPGSNTDRPLFLEMDSPLARSFLAFANASPAFRGRPRPNVEDGLLTAFEISGLDLSGTKLAVLSACETALGDIHGSEGVYGLQRAFKIAGAEHLIVSLWKVGDNRATLDFMSTFYQHFFSGLEIRDAFARTQREMRIKYQKPYLWAAFVLI